MAVDWLVGWLIGWLVGRSVVGWLVGRLLVGRSTPSRHAGSSIKISSKNNTVGWLFVLFVWSVLKVDLLGPFVFASFSCLGRVRLQMLSRAQ